MRLVTWFNIISTLSFFASTVALASGIFRNWVSQEYLIENEKKGYKFWGWLFGIHDRNDAINQFLLTSDRKKAKKTKDAGAPIRGILWALCGAIFSIAAILIS